MDITRPLVSIVIPCYNVDQFVEEGVESALNQTYSNIEIICVDDGSTDNTLQILRQLESENPEVVSVLTGPNSGASAARNRGLQQADGTWVQFLDADDLLRSNKIEHQIELVQRARTPADLVVSGYVVRSANGEHSIDIDRSDPWIGLVRTRLGSTPSNLWYKPAVLEAGTWDEALESSQETDLMFRMLKHNASLEFDDEHLTIVRRREGSISSTARGENWKRYIELRQRVLEFLKESNQLTPERESAIVQRLFRSIRGLYKHDPETALAYYERFIPDDFAPSVGPAITRPYVWCFKLLGFEYAERMRTVLGVEGEHAKEEN